MDSSGSVDLVCVVLLRPFSHPVYVAFLQAMKAEEPHTDNQTKVLEILWYRAQEKQRDVYEGIANTFVQLFLLRASGLIVNA
jgi:hypothetical protein